MPSEGSPEEGQPEGILEGAEEGATEGLPEEGQPEGTVEGEDIPTEGLTEGAEEGMEEGVPEGSTEEDEGEVPGCFGNHPGCDPKPFSSTAKGDMLLTLLLTAFLGFSSWRPPRH